MNSGPSNPNTASLDPAAAGFDELFAAAEAARQQGRHSDALGIFSEMRRRFPERSEPFRRASDLLIVLGSHEEGDFLLETAQTRFPTDAGIAIEYAWAAYRRRDMSEALARWRTVRENFPDHPLGYTGAVVTLRETGALDAADALLEIACSRFPTDPSPFIERAWMALARNDPALAVERWGAVRERFPDHWLGYSGGALAFRELQRLDEAEALLTAAVERFPDVYPVASEYAWLAAVRHDWQGALARWTAAIARFPGQPEPRAGQARALRELHRFDEAAQALAEAAARFDADPSLGFEAAMLAHDQADWPKAAELWASLRQRQPGELAGWRLGAVASGHLGHHEEAASLRAEADRRSPDPAAGLIRHTLQAIADRRWPEALEIANRLRERFPDYVIGYTAAAGALREMQRLDEAAGLLDAATERFRDTGEVRLERAWLAFATGDWEAAAEAFATCREVVPDQVEPVLGQIRSLCGAGRFDEAERVLANALDQFPGEAALAGERAAVPRRRAEWQAAQQRRTTVRPSWLPPPQLLPVPEPGPDIQASDPLLREFALRFVSLGGSRFGAEFGLVQIACGARPFDLLDRADVPLEELCAMLEARLQGVGEPENTEVFVMTGGGAVDAYGARDLRGWFTMRTLIPADAVEPETMKAIWCARLRYHARALANALAQGHRIFVYRMRAQTLPPPELGRLRAAMRRFGSRNTLLLVCGSDDANPDGTVTKLGEGLLLGRVRSEPPSLAPGYLPPMEAWLTALGNARAALEE
jgi:tetratricopeptide (TPR) repeat protein